MTETKFLTTYESVVSQTVAKLRDQKGISQAAFAEQVGLSPSTWSRIESGDSGLSIDHLKKVAEILGLKPHQLLEIADKVLEETPQLEVVTKKKEMVTTITAASAAAGMAVTAIPVTGLFLGGIIGAIAALVASQITEEGKK